MLIKFLLAVLSFSLAVVAIPMSMLACCCLLVADVLLDWSDWLEQYWKPAQKK